MASINICIGPDWRVLFMSEDVHKRLATWPQDRHRDNLAYTYVHITSKYKSASSLIHSNSCWVKANIEWFLLFVVLNSTLQYGLNKQLFPPHMTEELAQWVVDIIIMVLSEVLFMSINLSHATPGILYCPVSPCTFSRLYKVSTLAVVWLMWSSLNTLLLIIRRSWHVCFPTQDRILVILTSFYK